VKTVGRTCVVYLASIFAFLVYSGCLFAQSPSCGQPDDGLIHVPLNYNTFTPPAEGQSYVDPQYGCTVTRLTNSMQDSPIVPRHHYYSTLTPFNANSTDVMVFLDSGSNEIRDVHGNMVVSAASMPNANTGDEPWDPTDPSAFYYVNGNQFLKGTVSGGTVVSTVLHTFSNFGQVNIPDEEDLTDDGTKIWLIGNPGSECAGTGILYDRATDSVISQSLTLSSCHKIQIFPSGKMLCTNCNGNNVTIYNTDGSLYWNPPYPGSAHGDVGTDLQGREVLIHTANGEPSLNACADAWSSLTVVDINAKAPVNCLINGIPAWHVSYRDSSKGWAAVSFFDSGACPDYSCFFPQNLISTWQNLWPHYAEEVILVKIDGSQIQRIAHHRSRTAEYYWAQSHAVISRDGKYVAFDSNMDISNSGFVSPNQYSDVYLVPALAASSSLLTISPATIALTAGGSRTFSASGGASPYTFSILTNNSGGAINASTGAYTAGANGGVTDTVRVADSASNTGNATVTVLASLLISPATAAVNAGGSLSFSSSGGASPYTYSIVANNSGGTINASTGAYTAGTKASVTDTVRVTDSASNTGNATVTVRAALLISPASAAVTVGGSQTFSATGGASPYTFSILTNNSGGAINASTGVYTAGSTAGVTDIVRLTDAAGATSNATVTIQGIVVISPASAAVNVGASQTFTASGGASPYTFSILTNNSGGTINASTGAYTAGTKGGVSDTIRVTDSASNISIATVTVRAALVISPASVVLNAGGAQAFSASGGASPYTFSVVTNNSGATINTSTGAYTAGTKAGVTDTVQVTDSAGNTSNATVTVRAALVISPASVVLNAGGAQAFSASGGASPYTFSIVTNNSGGTINASTGAYTGGTKAGVSDTIRVADSAGNISNATVTVRAALAISPASAALNAGGAQTFSASGGASPYTFSIVTNNSGGTINASTGAYTGGTKAGVIDTVRVTDSASNTSNATVTINANGCNAIAKVQTVTAASASTASRSASITETAGHLLVAAVYWNGSDTASISDSLGNTWNSVPVQNNAATATDVRIFYAQNVKGGANTVTVKQPWAVTVGFYLIEYSGIATTNALDATSGKIAPGSSHSIDSGNVTTTGCRDLVVGLFADTWGGGTMAAGPGWISRGTDANFYSLVVDNGAGGTGTFDPKASLVGSNSDAAWAATAASFKAKQ
jgi:hypothetical protein